MLSEILGAFAMVAAMVAAVVVGVAAAEGLKWAMRAQPKERTEHSPEEIDAAVRAPADIRLNPSEESVMATLRDLVL